MNGARHVMRITKQNHDCLGLAGTSGQAEHAGALRSSPGCGGPRNLIFGVSSDYSGATRYLKSFRELYREVVVRLYSGATCKSNACKAVTP
jgi:hypothetical protein